MKVSQDDKRSILKSKQDKIDELKTLCRFCLCSENTENTEELKLIPVSKLESYNININDLMAQLGLNFNSQDIFSDVVCEQCFHMIVEIDNFRKKCKEIQQEILDELQVFDKKILELSNSKDYQEDELYDDYKEQIIIEEYKQPLDNSMEIIEEHLVDDQEELIDHEFTLGDEIPLEQIEYIEEIPFSDEQLKNEDIDCNEGEVIVSVSSVQLNPKQMNFSLEEEKMRDNVQGVDEYEDVSVDDIIKNPERNRFCFKIFECFFCKMVSFLLEYQNQYFCK